MRRSQSRILLNKKQVAELLHVSIRTVDALRKENLPFIQIGGQIRFLTSDILRWFEKQRIENEPTRKD